MPSMQLIYRSKSIFTIKKSTAKNSKKLTEAFIFIQTFPKQTKPFISHSTVATKNKKRRIRKKYVSVFYQHY